MTTIVNYKRNITKGPQLGQITQYDIKIENCTIDRIIPNVLAEIYTNERTVITQLKMASQE